MRLFWQKDLMYEGPGLRIYPNCQEIPKTLGGMQIAVLSTSRDITTN